MRSILSFVVVMMLASASLEGQAGPRGSAQPPKVVKVETPPVPVPTPKPAADTHAAPIAGTNVAPAKPVAHAPEKPAAPPVKTLEQAAESIAAALAARGVRPAARTASASAAPAVRAPRIKRYSLYWPADDTHWDVQWPVISGRVALTWDEPAAASEPASD